MSEADQRQSAEGDSAEAEVFGARREPVVLNAQAVESKKPIKQSTGPRRLRDSHHRVARLLAMGHRPGVVAQKTGYSSSRVSILQASPAFKELIERYRNEVDESFREAVDEYHMLATNNMLMAERQLSDKLFDADELDEPLPTKDLISISRDAADRFGYGKRETRLNLNVDFASQLERAIQRSGKIIDQTPQALPAISSSVQTAKPLPADSSLASREQSSAPTHAPVSSREGLRAVPAEVREEVKRSPVVGIRRRI